MPSSSRKSSLRPSTKPARFNKRYRRVEDLPVVNRHAAGIDLAGAGSHFVAIEIGDEIEVREFGGTTDEVKAMVRYLLDHGVTTVAMEATGVYWMVVYDLLEAADLEVCLVNPTHVKNVPGRRKDDKLDCRWLQKLHKYGLLSASFRPPLEDRPLQSLYRQRTRLIRLAADEMRRMHHALDVMNVRLHKVVSDVGGVTGMRIVRAIVEGEHDPATLATYRDPRCACSPRDRDFVDIGGKEYEERYRQRQIAAVTKRAKKLGLTVVVN
jgi:transposase